MSPDPLFHATGLAKRFGAVAALDGAELSVDRGEVHALVGENGAGKSTLLRIATGRLRADRGDMVLGGEAYLPHTPVDAGRHGVRVVSQEFDLAPNTTVAESLCLSSREFLDGCRNGWFGWKRAVAWARDRLDRVGVDVDPLSMVGDLSVSVRQLVAVVRGVLDDPRLVFLDEPSSALDEEGVRILTEQVTRLRDGGVAVVYVSHKLEEIFSLADRVTVMRDGRTVDVREVPDTTVDEVVQLMVGREIDRLFPSRDDAASGPIVLQARELTAPGVDGVDLVVRSGEILGIGGLVGSGRTELAKALAGLAPIRSGDIQVLGIPVTIRDQSAAIALGIEYVTEDRLGEGLVLTRPVAENICSRVLGRLSEGPFVRASAERRFAAGKMREFGIGGDPGLTVASLSGGNQQKTLLAACLTRDPVAVFLDEPTRGIDVGAKAQIYRLIRELAADRGVVVICSELIELMGLADRILIMRAGRFVAEFDAATASEEALVSAALGVERSRNSPGLSTEREALTYNAKQ
ncbi:MAG: sugar ABC transporter ATP-binding protein [Actinomycetota bacterium]